MVIQLQCDAAGDVNEWYMYMVFVTVQANSPCTAGLLSVGSLTILSLEEPGLRFGRALLLQGKIGNRMMSCVMSQS